MPFNQNQNSILGDKILYQYGSLLFPKINFSTSLGYQSSTTYDESQLTEVAIPNRVYDNNLLKPYQFDVEFVLTAQMGDIDSVLSEFYNKSLKPIFFRGLKKIKVNNGFKIKEAWYFNRAEVVSCELINSSKDERKVAQNGLTYYRTVKVSFKFERAGFYEAEDNLYFIDQTQLANVLPPANPTLPFYDNSTATYGGTTRYDIPDGFGYDLDYYLSLPNVAIDANNLTDLQFQEYVLRYEAHPKYRLYYKNFFFPEFNVANDIYVRGTPLLNDDVSTITSYLNATVSNTTSEGFYPNAGVYTTVIQTNNYTNGTLDLATTHTNDVIVLELSGTIPQGFFVEILNQSNNSGLTFTWLKNTYNDPNNPLQVYVHSGQVFSGENVYAPEIDGVSYLYKASDKANGSNLYFDGLISTDPLFLADQGQRLQISSPYLTQDLLKLKILKTYY